MNRFIKILTITFAILQIIFFTSGYRMYHDAEDKAWFLIYLALGGVVAFIMFFGFISTFIDAIKSKKLKSYTALLLIQFVIIISPIIVYNLL